ncbi:hypothetical protein GCM10025883_34000 [Mobilicoccus caccae]|uniref:Uncharacterized protein n=1 Tax=Mobilicoccus caccae TaxID=1859295 RepID=A0ABQ6IVF8_9MICO|nr:hypothetical protein GCM10025883_34000 [Mobilicoccus caccae]
MGGKAPGRGWPHRGGASEATAVIVSVNGGGTGGIPGLIAPRGSCHGLPRARGPRPAVGVARPMLIPASWSAAHGRVLGRAETALST